MEKAHTDKGPTCKVHTEKHQPTSRFLPARTFMLGGDSAYHSTTVPPQALTYYHSGISAHPAEGATSAFIWHCVCVNLLSMLWSLTHLSKIAQILVGWLNGLLCSLDSWWAESVCFVENSLAVIRNETDSGIGPVDICHSERPLFMMTF